MIAICREMGWDYFTYMSQPTFFLEAVRDHMVAEQRMHEKEMKKIRQGKK